MPVPPRSIALRLTVWYAATTLVLIAGVTWGQYRKLVAELAGGDDQLIIETLAAAQRTTVLAFSAAREGLEPAGPFVRVLNQACRTIAGAAPSAAPEPVCRATDGSRPLLRSATGRDGHNWRIGTQSALAPVAAEARPAAVWIEVALDRTRDMDVLGEHRRTLGSALVATLVVCTIVGYWIARRGLAPIESLALAVSSIDARSLGETLDVSSAPTELRSLVASFDVVRERLNAAFASLTQFSTELAHELRTPLHVLRQQTEVALARARTPDEYRDVMGSSLEELDRLHHMVDDILFLARAEDPRSRIERTDLPVAAELADVADYLESLAAEKGVLLEVDVPRALHLSADRMMLRRALVNVVTNAIRHTLRGGRVSLEAASRDGLVAIQVRDSGAGIPAAALPHVFDRYYRVPGTGSGGTEGTGLGLALVRGIVTLHGGWATVTSTLGEGTLVTLVFPENVSEGAPTDG